MHTWSAWRHRLQARAGDALVAACLGDTCVHGDVINGKAVVVDSTARVLQLVCSEVRKAATRDIGRDGLVPRK